MYGVVRVNLLDHVALGARRIDQPEVGLEAMQEAVHIFRRAVQRRRDLLAYE
jgi:hypothetical protein